MGSRYYRLAIRALFLHIPNLMKAELLPLIFGALICLIGIAIGFDAMRPAVFRPQRERRRRVRAEINPTGQLLVGAGTFCLGAALVGRDTWRLGTLVVFAGIALLLAGAVMSREYLKELMLFRGASRRSDESEKQPEALPDTDDPKRQGTLRIR